MKKIVPKEKLEPTFAEVFPGLSSEELREAEYNFREYLRIASEIVRKQEEAASNHKVPDVD